MRFRILASILTLALAGIASATPIKFTYTGTGSGDLSGTAFSNAAFTISALGDTSARQDDSAGYFIDHINASIDIAGVGNVAFITGTRTFVNNLAGIVGFSRAGATGQDLYNGPFEYGIDWDMLSDLGPITGTFGLFQWDMGAVDTSGAVPPAYPYWHQRHTFTERNPPPV